MRTITKEMVLVFTISIFFASTAWSATYYVSPSPAGNDANSGTQASPWATLQKAANTLQAGDTVVVNNGTYVGFRSNGAGTASLPITFKANETNVIINTPYAGHEDNIYIDDSYIIIDGFTIQNAPRAGIWAVLGSGLVLKNNIITSCGYWGILTGFTPEIQVLNNTVSGSNASHGIYVGNSSVTNDNIVIKGNISYSNFKHGIQVNGDCQAGGDGIIMGATIENNIAYNNGMKGFSLISMQSSTVQNNLIYNNGGDAGGIHLADEPGCSKPSNNNTVVNNTIIEPDMAGIRMTDGSTNNVIFNNLVISTSPIADDVGGNVIDGSSNISSTSVAGLFVDPLLGNYHLLSSSSSASNSGKTSYSGNAAPAVDLDGIKRPQGNGIDSGTYEYNTAPQKPTNLEVK